MSQTRTKAETKKEREEARAKLDARYTKSLNELVDVLYKEAAKGWLHSHLTGDACGEPDGKQAGFKRTEPRPTSPGLCPKQARNRPATSSHPVFPGKKASPCLPSVV